ncbi:unnamed protein product [Amoebophrya sp. A25]|nr:unnamed protein product [Amoebophrya sp. A25]|eukprot:GSA25T00026662001.1
MAPRSRHPSKGGMRRASVATTQTITMARTKITTCRSLYFLLPTWCLLDAGGLGSHAFRLRVSRSGKNRVRGSSSTRRQYTEKKEGTTSSRDIAMKMNDVTSGLTTLSHDFNQHVLHERLQAFADNADATLETHLADMKLLRQQMNARRNNADILRTTTDKQIEIQVDDLNDAKDAFVEFLNGVQAGAFSGNDAKDAAEQEANALRNVLNLVASEPSAGSLRGSLEQMIADTDNDGALAAEKTAELAALTQDAVSKIQKQIDLTTEELDFLMEKKQNATGEFFRSKYVSSSLDDVITASREELTLVEELEQKVRPMTQRNVERIQRIGEHEIAMVKLSQDIEAFEGCVAASGGGAEAEEAVDDCLGEIGREYTASGENRTELAMQSIQFIGCYEDKGDRAMPHMIPGARTVSQCSQDCADFGFFAIQYGAQCFCGNEGEYEKYGSHPDAECKSPSNSPPCVDPSTDRMCGGPWRNAVFRQPSASSFLSVSMSKKSAPSRTNAPSPAVVNKGIPTSLEDHSLLAKLNLKSNLVAPDRVVPSPSTSTSSIAEKDNRVARANRKNLLSSARSKLRDAMSEMSGKKKQETSDESSTRATALPVRRQRDSEVVRSSTSTRSTAPSISSSSTSRLSSSTSASQSPPRITTLSDHKNDASSEKIQLAADVLIQVSRAFGNQFPALAAFGQRMLTQDAETDVRALNLLEKQLQTREGRASLGFQRTAASRGMCSPEQLNNARERVTAALDKKLATEKDLVEAQGRAAVLEAVAHVHSQSIALEQQLLRMGDETWTAIDEECRKVIADLDGGGQSDAVTQLKGMGTTFVAGSDLPKGLQAEVTTALEAFEDEVGQFRDDLEEECVNHTASFLKAVRKHMTGLESEEGAGAAGVGSTASSVDAEVIAKQAALATAKSELDAAREAFDDIAATCPGTPSEGAQEVSLRAVQFAKQVLEGSRRGAEQV